MQQNQSGTRVGSRVVFDPETNTQWVVIEIRDASYDRRGGRSLVFTTDGVMRCVCDYPADWFTLRDFELLLLSTRR